MRRIEFIFTISNPTIHKINSTRCFKTTQTDGCFQTEPLQYSSKHPSTQQTAILSTIQSKPGFLLCGTSSSLILLIMIRDMSLYISTFKIPFCLLLTMSSTGHTWIAPLLAYMVSNSGTIAAEAEIYDFSLSVIAAVFELPAVERGDLEEG